MGSELIAVSRYMIVFILWHIRELENGEDETKLIGVYSTEQLAEAARERSRQLPGFRDLPDGFIIDRYAVDKDHWTEGYILP